MCGGAIIPETVKPSPSSRRLIADLLWGSGVADLNSKKNYHSNPLIYKSVVDVDDDFEAEFEGFKHYSVDEEESDGKSLCFSASKRSALRGKI